jgi:hypothetical protein
MSDVRQTFTARFRRAIPIAAHIVICCVSLVCVAHFQFPNSPFDPKTFHMFYDPARLYGAVAIVAAFAPVALLFVVAEFSFGYFVGFYLYTMVFGYLWLSYFSDFDYDRVSAFVSAAASAVVFLLPALFITSPIGRPSTLSERAFERLLLFILLISAATIVAGASYNFRLVSFDNIYQFRDNLESPAIVSYLVGMTSSALLPFAFACFLMRKDYWLAALVLFLLVLIYPITLSKVALFAPLWLVAIAVLSRIAEARIAVVLSLLLPTLMGVLLFSTFKVQSAKYFGTVNLRFIAIPSDSLDVYNDFFSRNDLTYFCQINVLKKFISCPYQEPLAVVMKDVYNLGNLTASLFATEGTASLGLAFAPVAVFVCGLVIALANRLSAGLPPRFILISSAVLPPLFLNVPLTIILLTHGGVLLFLLWYVTPRAMFEQKITKQAAFAG